MEDDSAHSVHEKYFGTHQLWFDKIFHNSVTWILNSDINYALYPIVYCPARTGLTIFIQINCSHYNPFFSFSILIIQIYNLTLLVTECDSSIQLSVGLFLSLLAKFLTSLLRSHCSSVSSNFRLSADYAIPSGFQRRFNVFFREPSSSGSVERCACAVQYIARRWSDKSSATWRNVCLDGFSEISKWLMIEYRMGSGAKHMFIEDGVKWGSIVQWLLFISATCTLHRVSNDSG